LLDTAEQGRAGPSWLSRSWKEGPDWACMFESREDARRGTLVRHIVSFRRIGKSFRRREETHRLRLHTAGAITAMLSSAGFQVERLTSYGKLSLPQGWSAIVAVKPEKREASPSAGEVRGRRLK
jgi:hypothetical protein